MGLVIYYSAMSSAAGLTRHWSIVLPAMSKPNSLNSGHIFLSRWSISKLSFRPAPLFKRLLEGYFCEEAVGWGCFNLTRTGYVLLSSYPASVWALIASSTENPNTWKMWRMEVCLWQRVKCMRKYWRINQGIDKQTGMAGQGLGSPYNSPDLYAPRHNGYYCWTVYMWSFKIFYF